MANRKPPVLVSACLLGEPVRYDGGHKRHAWLVERLLPEITMVAVCPEVGIGLGVPRPPIQLVESETGVRARGVEDPGLDVTDTLNAYGRQQAHDWLCGAILKSRSPSCGLGTTPLFDADGHETGLGSGLFAASLQAALPGLPCIDEAGLDDPEQRERWLEAVRARHRRLAEPGWIRLTSAPDLVRLQPMRDALALAGIPFQIRNEYLGGALGELPAQEIWPEIWVSVADHDRARAALEQFDRTAAVPEEEWTCPNCGETNGPAFEVCWRCGAPRPA